MSNDDKQSEQLDEYRKWLVSAEQKSQEAFDKTVLSLSGGALAISFTFIKDIIGPESIVLTSLLIAAWLAWAFSTFAVLCSYYLSHLALRQAITQVDNGTIYKQPPGGKFACLTAMLNAAGAVLFLVGICCITIFAAANLSSEGATNVRQKTNASTISTITPNSTATTTPPDTRQPPSINGGVHSPTSSASAVQK